MKKSRKLLMILGIVLSLAIATGSTLAYLTDTDSDVNVMTLGNVSIKQHEYERIPTENGFEKVETDSGEGYMLQDFTQGKPLYPFVGDVVFDETPIYFDQLGENAGGDTHVTSVNNAQDKVVVVENDGKSDAYVRTIIAVEGTDQLTELVGLVYGTGWEQTKTDFEVQIGDGTYCVVEFVYVGTKDRHPGGLIPAGEYTTSSLNQVLLSSEATNEDVAALDTNGNGTYDILVFSQAVQAAGFDNAKDALEKSFGTLSVDNHPWKDEEPVIPKLIYNYDQMVAACYENGSYVIGQDFDMDYMAMAAGFDIAFDLNGYELTHVTDQYTLGAQNGGKLRIHGNGTMNMTKGFFVGSAGEVVLDGGTYRFGATAGNFSNRDNSLKGTYCSYLQHQNTKMIINDGVFTTDIDNAALFYVNSNAVLEINGGFFENTADKTPVLLAGGMSNSSKNRIILKGGTFVNFNPMTDIAANKLGVSYAMQSVEDYDRLPVGCVCVLWPGYEVISEPQENGDIWYTVVKK